MVNEKNPLTKLKEHKLYPYLIDVLYFLLAFAITFLIYVFIFQSLGFYPFKEDGLTSLMSDQRDQYIAYMRTYQNILKNGGSLTYTLSKTFGGDFQSLFAYYLASPFNLLLVFISSKDIPAFFVFSLITKMSFASGNTYLLARYLSKKRRPIFLAFSIAYGLISYAFVFMCNFMYMDALMIFPLIFLGLKQLENEHHYWLYPLSLGYALFCNWYAGGMICIFLVIYFLLNFIFLKRSFQEKLKYLLRFFVFSLMAGLLSSFVWFSAFMHFSGTKASISLPYFKVFNWALFFEGLLENNYLSYSAISRNEGYMSAFVSVVTLLFAMLYFSNKKHSRREKTTDGMIMLIYFISTIISVFYALFHGGRTPIFFPTRYSFIIGFYLCYLAIKESADLEDTPIWGLAIPGGVSLILLPILTLAKKNTLAGSKEEILYPLSLASLLIFIFSFVIIALYFLYLLLAKKKNINSPTYIGKVVEISILALTLISSYRGGYNVINTNVKDNIYQDYSTYLRDDTLSPVFDKVKNEDSSLYRMEATFNRFGSRNTINNNPLFYSYNGLNHYSSTEKSNISSYMRRIGFHRNSFWERYSAGSTEAMNSFLGIKYLIDKKDLNSEKPQFLYNESSLNLFKETDTYNLGDDLYHYYTNEYALPLGFVVDPSSSYFVSQGGKKEGKEETYWYDHFEYQNEIYHTMDRSINKDIFYKIPTTNETYSEGVKIIKTDVFGRKTYSLEKGSSIVYNFVITPECKNNNLYIFEQSENQDIKFYLDGSLLEINNYWNSGIHSFNAEVGSKHTLLVTYSKDSTKEIEINPEIYYEDLSILQEYLSNIKKGGSTNLKVSSSLSSTTYEGTFSFQKDDGEFLFSIPNDKNFSIYLDGKKQETMTRFDIFTAISLKGVEKGEHAIKLVYKDKGLLGGTIISSISILGFVPLIIFYPRLEKMIFKRKDEPLEDSPISR